MVDREPIGSSDRPNGDMTDPRRAQRPDHVTHDVYVIAAAADRDADDTTRLAAERQVADCADCATLFADLQTISSGLASLPRSLPVSRDFRISPERASRLSRGGWRRFLDGFSRAPTLRPFASALTTLGLAGLVLTVALPSLSLFGGASGGAFAPPILSTVGSAIGSSAPAAQAEPPSGVKSDGASAPPRDNTGGQTAVGAPDATAAALAGGPSASGVNRTSTGGGAADGTDVNLYHGEPQPAGPSPQAILAWLSVALVLIGVGLLWLARSGARDRTS